MLISIVFWTSCHPWEHPELRLPSVSVRNVAYQCRLGRRIWGTSGTIGEQPHDFSPLAFEKIDSFHWIPTCIFSWEVTTTLVEALRWKRRRYRIPHTLGKPRYFRARACHQALGAKTAVLDVCESLSMPRVRGCKRSSNSDCGLPNAASLPCGHHTMSETHHHTCFFHYQHRFA